MRNAIILLKLFALLVAALVVTIVGVAVFIPYAIFRICATMRDIIEDKVEAIILDIKD